MKNQEKGKKEGKCGEVKERAARVEVQDQNVLPKGKSFDTFRFFLNADKAILLCQTFLKPHHFDDLDNYHP